MAGLEQLNRRGARRLLAVPAALLAVLLSSCAGDNITVVEQTQLPTESEATSTEESADDRDWEALMEAVPGLQPQADTFAPVAIDSDHAAGDALTVRVDAADYEAAPAEDATDWSHENVGLSFELRELNDPRWNPDESNLDLVIGALEKPALRFGGNSADRRVWFTESNEPAPEWSDITLTPEHFENLGRFAEETDASVSLVLVLGRYDAERAASMARVAKEHLGDRLVGVTIGNEPNGFYSESRPERTVRDNTWGVNSYVEELLAYVEAVHEEVPGLPIAGPGTFDPAWWDAFLEADIDHTAALTQHWYPLWSCPGRPSGGERKAEPLVENLVTPLIHSRAISAVGKAVDEADAAGLPMWLEETGPTACSGSNETSRTHAQALWTVDFVLNIAHRGVDRAAFHSMIDACSGGAPMSAVCSVGEMGDASAELTGQANFLALMFASQVDEGEFVPVQLEELITPLRMRCAPNLGLIW